LKTSLFNEKQKPSSFFLSVINKRLRLIVASLRERRGSLKVHLLLSEGGALDVSVVELRVGLSIGEITLIVPLNIKVGGVEVVVHTNLLVEHLIRPEPETAKILIIAENIKLSLDGTEPVGDLGRDVEWSAISILLLGCGIITEHANLGKILLNRMLHADQEVTILGVRITDGIINALELGGLKRNRKEVVHEFLVKASVLDIILAKLAITHTTRRTSFLLHTRDPVLRVKRTRADSLLVPTADVLHPICNRVRATATTTIGALTVGKIVPAVTDDETTSLTLLGSELIVVANHVHSVATLTDGLTMHEELTVHVEHRRKHTGASLRTIVTISWALNCKTRRTLSAALPIRIIAREEVDSVVHLRRPGKRTILLDHQTLSLHDIVSSGHALDVELDGIGFKSFLHARAFVFMSMIRPIGANRARKNLIVQILQVVEPPDFTTFSAVVEDKVTNDIANIRMILASLDHRKTISLLIQTNVLILLQEILLDTILTVALLKDTDCGKVPASATVLLIITRSLVLCCITIRKISVILCTSSIELLEATSTSNAFSTSAMDALSHVDSSSLFLFVLEHHACLTCDVSHRDASKKHASDNG